MANHDRTQRPTGDATAGTSRAELADRQLRRIFAEMARPQLSPFFEAHLRQRLARQRRQRLIRRCGRLMAGYWLATTLASTAVLFLLPRPELATSPTLQAALVLTIVTAIAPLLVLTRILGTGFIDTIIGTFDTGGPARRQ